MFGNNGAGKSGYGRLLRRVCRAAAPEEVLRDVFDPGASAAPQSATVTVRRRAAEDALAVDLAAAPPRVLSAVGVFDTRCADMYLSKPSVIDWSRSSLRLAGERDALAAGLREEAITVREHAPDVMVASAGSSAAAAVAALDGETDLEALERVAALSEEEREELARLRGAQLAGDAGRAALRGMAVSRASAARAAAQLLAGAMDAVSDARMAAVCEARADPDTARSSSTTRSPPWTTTAAVGSPGAWFRRSSAARSSSSPTTWPSCTSSPRPASAPGWSYTASVCSATRGVSAWSPTTCPATPPRL